MTHGLRHQVPGLLESLYGGGAEGSSDLEHRHKVVELEGMSGRLQPEADEGVALSGLIRRENCLGDPLRHLIEPSDHMTDVGGQFQPVLLGPLLLKKLTARF